METEDVNTPQTIAEIASRRPDLIVVAAFGQKIGRELIDMPGKGMINIHASLLPKYRGAAPINRAIVNGETTTGVTIFRIQEKMDSGPVCAQAATRILDDETAGELHDRLAQLSAPLLLDTLAKLAAGTATYAEQDHDQATFAPKLKKSDGFLDFHEPAELLARQIRGFWPWPGASATHVSERTGKATHVTLALADVVQHVAQPPSAGITAGGDGATLLSPGTFDDDLNVACGADKLTILKLKPAGSALMDFKDFANGWHVHPGDKFVKVDQ